MMAAVRRAAKSLRLRIAGCKHFNVALARLKPTCAPQQRGFLCDGGFPGLLSARAGDASSSYAGKLAE